MENEDTEYIPTIKLVNDYVTKLGAVGRVAVKQVGSMTVYGSIEAGAKDDDVLVCVEEGELHARFEQLLDEEGFYCEGAYRTEDTKFISNRRDLNNIILTNDPDYFDLYALSNDVVEELGLYNKDHRIMVFTAIMDRELYNPNRPAEVAPPPAAGPLAGIRGGGIRFDDFVAAQQVLDNGRIQIEVPAGRVFVNPQVFRWADNANF